MRGLRFGALFALVAAIGLVGATGSLAASTTSASTALVSERTSAAFSDRECGPCPSIVFSTGSGTGTIELWHVWKGSLPNSKDDVCTPAVRGQCIFYIDEGINAQDAYLVARATSGTFAGWDGCPETDSANRCHITPGSMVSMCAVFRVGSENPGTCPPPSVQLYKKGVTVPGTTGGTVTVTGSTAPSVTCGVSCPSSVQTSWAPGDRLTLRATPAAGFEFVRWDGCPEPVQPDLTCQLTLQKSETICSVFVQAGAAPPTSLTCPYLTPPIVRNPKPPASTPPALGSRCTIRGSSGRDVINGTARNDVICGLGGNDVIYGKGGNDLLVGGGGTDRLYGQAGNDRIVGGSGKDALYGAAGADILYGRDTVRDVVNGGRGSDRGRVDRRDAVRSIERRF